jgi:hypothetical protein
VLFLPDSDGEDRNDEFNKLEMEFVREALQLNKRVELICCAAVPEVEAWVLAGHEDKWEQDWQWGRMRADASFKENYFNPFLQRHGQDQSIYPDGGRRQLMQAALRNFVGIKQRCPELQHLENRIRNYLANIATP